MLSASLPALHTVVALGFMILVVASAIEDARRMVIPNRYCLSIVLLYPAHVLTAPDPVQWWIAILVSGVLFALGFLIYLRGWTAGGDAKLVAAVGLWAGADHVAGFLILTALAGGLMAIALWLRHRAQRAPSLGMIPFTQADPDFARKPMPYGVSIGAGGLYVAFTVLGLL